jgi:hypothetical protein
MDILCHPTDYQGLSSLSHEVAHVWYFTILRQTHISLLVGKVTHVWIRSAVVGALGGTCESSFGFVDLGSDENCATMFGK